MSWVQQLLLLAVVSSGQDVVIYGPSFTQPLFENLQDAFFLGHHREVKYEPSTPDQITLHLEAGQPVLLTSLNLTLPESALSFPLFGFPFVVAYNLNASQLFLSQDALLAIFQGRITRWNHANLTLLNPSISLPNEAIILVVGPLLNDFIQGLSVFAGAPVDSSFLLTSNNTVILEKDVASYVKITPYSMGFSWMADAIATSAALAFLENMEHRYASPYTGVSSALSEFHAAQQQEHAVLPHNLDGRLTWPLIGLVYLVLPGHVDSCTELKTIQDFVSMILILSSTDRFVQVLGWEPASALTRLDSSLGSISNRFDYSELLQGITCQSVEEIDVFQIGASIQLLSPVLKLLVAYSVINPFFLLEPSRNNITNLLDAQLVGKIPNGKDIDLSLTWAPLLTDYPNLISVPVFMGSMAPIVNLGQNMSIVLSVPVLASIYSGTIRYWNDSQIKSLNLGVSLPDQQIIVYAAPLTQPDRPSALFSVLLRNSPTTSHFNWSKVNITLPGSTDMERLVRATPFSIGYGFGHSLEDTSLVPKMMNPSNRAIAFSPSALAACWPNQDNSNCWPLALPLVAVLRRPTGYHTCEQQKVGVDFIGWILHQNTSLEQFLVPNLQADGQSMGEVEYCQGRSLRYTFPEPQLLLEAEVSVVEALCGIGMIWSVSQALALGVARNNSHLKSASVFFSLLAVVGIFMMLVTPLLIVSDDLTMTGCGASVWLLSFGFSLTYGSLFAKLFRLYKIFTTRSLVVPRLSNLKLLLIVMVFLAIDFILLLIYNIISPPEPATFSRLIPSEEDLVTGHRELTWTMCTFHDSPALYLLLAVKCLMALSAAAMSFSLRQLDRRFSAISALGGSFYNMFGSVVVAIVILVFFQSSEPTQFLYVPVFCGLWITFITLLALVVDSNVLLVCDDLSRPLRKLWNSSKDSKDKKNPSGTEDNSRSSSSKIFVVNREMFPSKYEHYDQVLLEKVLEELNFQRQAVRRVLASATTATGSPIQLTELDRLRTSTQEFPPTKKSRSGLVAQPGDLSPRGSSRESKSGDLPIPSGGNFPFKVVVDAPVSSVASGSPLSPAGTGEDAPAEVSTSLPQN